jgi:hypothetical protein
LWWLAVLVVDFVAVVAVLVDIAQAQRNPLRLALRTPLLWVQVGEEAPLTAQEEQMVIIQYSTPLHLLAVVVGVAEVAQ